MKNSGNETKAKKENHDEQRRGPTTPKATVTNRSKLNPKDAPNATPKKTKYDKLWVPKTAHTSSSHSSTKGKVKKTPLASVTTLNCLKGSSESETETETQKVTNFESFDDALPTVDKIDVSTQTVERSTVDVSISCACEVADKATGSHIPNEYRCSTKSIATTDQWDRRILSRPELTRDEYSRDREEFLSSPESQGRFTIEPKTSWAQGSDLIYEEESHSHRIPVDKPKYVTTCESFGQSTDKSLSISHDFYDAAVGSSIIIEENGKNVSTATERSDNENPRKSLHCEVCTACRQLFRGSTVPQRTSKPSQLECISCTNDRQIRDDRNRKRHAFSTSSEKSEDFISNPQNISESLISRSNARKDTREKSAGQETSIAELKSSRLSKNYKSSNDSMAFWHDNAKARNINEPRNSRPLHESTKLNLESINDFHRAPLTFSNSRGSQPRNEQIKLATALSRSNKNYPPEREINVRTCDFDEVILRRRYKPRSHDLVRPREKESTRKYPIVDKLEPLSNRDSDNALTLKLKEFNQLSQDRDQQRKFLSGCRFSEINNFGKMYDWNKPMDMIVHEILRCEAPGRRKAWKSSNGSVARNKCHCHN